MDRCRRTLPKYQAEEAARFSQESFDWLRDLSHSSSRGDSSSFVRDAPHSKLGGKNIQEKRDRIRRIVASLMEGQEGL
jgi:hypothetical protein